MDIRSRQPSGRVPDRPRKPRHLGKAAGTREGIAGRPDRPFDGYPCLGSLALASGPDPADEQTLALVGVCVNRIGKLHSSWTFLPFVFGTRRRAAAGKHLLRRFFVTCKVSCGAARERASQPVARLKPNSAPQEFSS